MYMSWCFQINKKNGIPQTWLALQLAPACFLIPEMISVEELFWNWLKHVETTSCRHMYNM